MYYFMKIAYSTEVFTEKTICCDTSACGYSEVYEHMECFVEFTNYCAYGDIWD